MTNIHVTREQLEEIKEITCGWNGHSRWLLPLDDYLMDLGIYHEERFLAGGIDHIDETRDSVTVHDRCLATGSGTKDGTTKFVVARKRNSWAS